MVQYRRTERLGLNRYTWVMTCFLLALAIFGSGPQAVCQNAFEGYFLRSANQPGHDNLWTLSSLADGESQGVTNDDDNWYFTWTYDNVGYLIKVPVGVPLEDNLLDNPNVIVANMTQFSELAGYWHWGDPDHYRFRGNDYIVIPITGGGSPIIAIFRTDLSLAAFAKLQQPTESWCDGALVPQRSVGWCAIHPKTGILYTSEDFDYVHCFPYICFGGSNNGQLCSTSGDCPGSVIGCKQNDCDMQDYHFDYRREVLAYTVPWDIIPLPGDAVIELPLEPIEPRKQFLAEDGQFLELYNMQGGEFSPGGELLFVSSGSGCCLGYGVGQQYAIDGIHVFDTGTWRETTRSSNHDPDFPISSAPAYFDYYYPFGCDGAGSWSPQGLTIWDLDNERAPGISGQLHVLLFKFRISGANRQVFAHFGNRLYVNSNVGIDQPLVTPTNDEGLPGSPQKPFRTLGFTYNNYPAWQGSEICLQAGSYPETISISKRIRLTARGGTVIIGR